MNRILRVFLILFISVLFESCATIISGTKQKIPVVTNVPGASVYLDGTFQDTTPCIVKVKRSWESPPQIALKKDSFRTENVYLEKHFNELIILNFVNIFAWGIDAASGSVWRYNQLDTIELQPVVKRR